MHIGHWQTAGEQTVTAEQLTTCKAASVNAIVSINDTFKNSRHKLTPSDQQQHTTGVHF